MGNIEQPLRVGCTCRYVLLQMSKCRLGKVQSAPLGIVAVGVGEGEGVTVVVGVGEAEGVTFAVGVAVNPKT
jgi:hypothetical protein